MSELVPEPTNDHTPEATPEPPPEPERTLSQSEVNRLVQDRLARQKAQFADYDDLKAKAAKLDEIEESNRSELERAIARAEAAEAERDKTQTEAREARLRAALLAEVAKTDRRVVDPEAALQLLDKSSLELDENGLPTNTAQAVDLLLEQRPFLVSQAGGAARGNADQGARPGGTDQLTDADLKSMSPEQIDKAHREGRLRSLLGAS